MSKSYKMIERPARWVSAHRKNEFKYSFLTRQCNIVNASGYARIILNAAFPFTTEVGQRIYIVSGSYKGYHTIQSIQGSLHITLNTAYSGAVFSWTDVWQIVLPEVKLYKGYKDGQLVLPLYPSGSQDLYDVMPYTLIGTFYPESGPDGYLRFDISGYLKTAIETPYKLQYNDDETDYNYPITAQLKVPVKNYNKIELIIEGTCECVLYAANSSISTDDLNRYYVDTNRQMQPLLQPVSLLSIEKVGNKIGGPLQVLETELL